MINQPQALLDLKQLAAEMEAARFKERHYHRLEWLFAGVFALWCVLAWSLAVLLWP